MSIPDFISNVCESRMKFEKHFSQFSKSSFVKVENTKKQNKDTNEESKKQSQSQAQEQTDDSNTNSTQTKTDNTNTGDNTTTTTTTTSTPATQDNEDSKDESTNVDNSGSTDEKTETKQDEQEQQKQKEKQKEVEHNEEEKEGNRYEVVDFNNNELFDVKFYYLQTSLGEAVPELMEDYCRWNAYSFQNFAVKMKWGPLTANLLLIGMKGALTPLHFDEQENIFLQLNGKKEVLLFNQYCGDALYSFPYGHACDRQSMINAEFPFVNDNKIHNKYSNLYFENNSKAQCFRAILKPGDALYIPNGWWHEFVNLNDFATSVTFWSVPRSVVEKNERLKNINLAEVECI